MNGKLKLNFDPLAARERARALEEKRVREQAQRPKEQLIEQQLGDSLPAKDHPRFSKFFVLKKRGAPIMMLQTEMKKQGIDPKILSRPNQLIELTRQEKQAYKRMKQQEKKSSDGEVGQSDEELLEKAAKRRQQKLKSAMPVASGTGGIDMDQLRRKMARRAAMV